MNNVILTEEEYSRLKANYPDSDSLIDRLSTYMESTGKQYSSHYATLTRWAEEDMTRTSVAPVYKPYTSKQPTNTKAASSPKESSFDIDEFFEAALRQSDERMLRKRAVG